MKSVTKKIFTAVLASGLIGIAAPASADAIADRQAKMETVGKSIGVVGKMAKGETEFDSAVALQAFVDMKAAAEGFETLFPDGSDQGKTEASPKIFSDRSGFEAKQADFVAALEVATASAPADIDALRATLGQVGQNCGACHKAYRVKKN